MSERRERSSEAVPARGSSFAVPPKEGTSRAFVGLGGNIGSDEEIRARFDAACGALEVAADGAVARSRVYRSAPAGPVREQPRFLNMVAAFEPRPGLTPRALLEILRAIESAHGRTREVPQGPRTLDLDLLLFGDAVVLEPDLVVPHPRMGHRPFVLVPLLELLGFRLGATEQAADVLVVLDDDDDGAGGAERDDRRGAPEQE